MNNLESYSLLFSDSFFANLAIDTSTELVIHTLKIFGNYNEALIVMVASIGFTVASMANYLLGKVIFKIIAPSDATKYTEMLDRMKSLPEIQYLGFKLLPIILLFSATPFFGKFIVLFAGLCNVRFFYTIAITTLAKFAYYSYLILV